MKLFHAASILAATICVAVGAKADWKIQSGVTCQARDPDASLVYVDASGITAEGVVNVYCPVLRDTTGPLTQLEVGFTGINDGHLQCTLFTRNLANSVSDTVTSEYNGILNFGILSMDLSGFDEGTDQMYILRCSLEANERIIGIEYTE